MRIEGMSTPPSTPYVIPLDQLDRRDLSVAGGKGANLGAMLKAGLPVPDGFCITAATYRAVAQADAPALRAAIADLEVDDTAALEASSRLIRATIEARP